METDLTGWSSRFPSRIVETPSERDAACLFCSAKVSGEACFGCLNLNQTRYQLSDYDSVITPS